MIDRLRLAGFGVCCVSLLSLCSSASGALIVQSLSYDGSVRVNASTAVEEHDVAAAFPQPVLNIPLPATNNLNSPFDDPYDLMITAVDLSAGAPLNGDIFPRMTIWIKNPNPSDFFDMFANPLDLSVATPVRLELSLYLQDLAANEQLVVHHRYETVDGEFPFPPFVETAPSTGRGSQADPLRLYLGLPSGSVDEMFNFGFVKTHLYYDTDIIPEPAAAVLMLIGIAFASLARRRG
jgi:hypothetical protein